MKLPSAAAQSTEGLISRAVAAQLLAVSKSTVRRLEETGKLHSRTDGSRTHYFDAAEVARLAVAQRKRTAATPDDELAAQAFEMFADHASLREIVIHLRMPPERVATLHQHWLDFGRLTDMSITPAQQEELVGISGFGLDRPADFVNLVRALVDERNALRAELDQAAKPEGAGRDAPQERVVATQP